MSKYILSVDIGTSSVRAMLFSESGKVETMHQIQYGVEMPKTGWQEQNPDEIAMSVISCIKQCIGKTQVPKENIAGMSFSSQMYSIFPVDFNGNPLMNSIIWADSRSDEQAEKLKVQYGTEYFYERTACPIDSLYPLCKLLWIKETHPDIYQNAYKFISIKEYILHKFIGDYVIDYTCASATGLFNVYTHKWEDRALNVLSIDESKLSVPLNVTAYLELANSQLAHEMGLDVRFPLIIGGGDGPLANIGSGTVHSGDINIDLGTSGAARTIVDIPVLDPDSSLWCYCLTDDKWALGGILNNVGNFYKWFTDNVAFYGQEKSDGGFSVLNNYAASSKPGANGLYFLPFLLKARSPFWDSRLSGTIYGLNPSHTVQDITRASIEGVAFNLYSIIKAIHNNHFGDGKLVLTGGLGKSVIWGQIISDIIGERLFLPGNQEGSAGGAAIVGFYALGIIDSLEFRSEQTYIHIYEPDLDNTMFYQNIHSKYMRVCQAIMELNAHLDTEKFESVHM